MVALVVAGCGGIRVGGEEPARPRPGQRSASDNARVRAYADEIRAKWSSDAHDDERLDKLEKDAVAAFEQALGKKAVHGGEAPHPSSQSITELRASPIKIKVEPLRLGDGREDPTYVHLTDSYSQRMGALQRKVAEQTLTRAETAEIQGGSKYLFKVNDVRTSVSDISQVAFEANLQVRLIANANILRAQVLTQTMASLGTEDLAADREVVKKNLVRQRRAEALAAVSVGMVTAFVAVVNDGKNPKAIDAIAEAGTKAFPSKIVVTDEEAGAFLEAWRTAPPRTHETYERDLRKRYGDAEYEKSYRAQVDTMWKSAPPPPAPPPGATERVEAATSAAQALAKKDAAGTLDAAAKAFPGDGTVRHSLEGAAALARGDTKKALQSALDLVPGGGLVKDGLGLASKLLFGT